MKYLSSYSAIWKLTDAKYKAFLQAVAETKEDWYLDDFGKRICDDHLNVTDITSKEAADKLNDLKLSRGSQVDRKDRA